MSSVFKIYIQHKLSAIIDWKRGGDRVDFINFISLPISLEKLMDYEKQFTGASQLRYDKYNLLFFKASKEIWIVPIELNKSLKIMLINKPQL